VLTNAAATGTLLATTMQQHRKLAALQRRGVSVVTLPGRNGTLSLRRLLQVLASRGISSVLLEGGATLAATALRERVVDRLLLFVAPKLIGADGVPMIGGLGVKTMRDVVGMRVRSVEPVGDDWLVHAVPERAGGR
jgi:diaminohydroxyphosphoribosylaminopyrimidine deaminase/5-amino-6-(5-phosphoribosylamino)uracil reductase